MEEQTRRLELEARQENQEIDEGQEEKQQVHVSYLAAYGNLGRPWSELIAQLNTYVNILAINLDGKYDHNEEEYQLVILNLYFFNKLK